MFELINWILAPILLGTIVWLSAVEIRQLKKDYDEHGKDDEV